MKTSEANELVTVESFQNEIEAEIAKGRLKGEGIKSFTFKDDCGGTRPHMQLTLGVELKVCQIDFARASETLEATKISTRTSDDLKPGENKAAIYSLLAWIFCFCGCGLLLMGLPFGKALFPIGTAILIAGILFGISSRNVKKEIESK